MATIMVACSARILFHNREDWVGHFGPRCKQLQANFCRGAAEPVPTCWDYTVFYAHVSNWDALASVLKVKCNLAVSGAGLRGPGGHACNEIAQQRSMELVLLLILQKAGLRQHECKGSLTWIAAFHV